MSFILSYERDDEKCYLYKKTMSRYYSCSMGGWQRIGSFRSDIHKSHVFKTYYDVLEYIITEYGLINIATSLATFYIIDNYNNKKYDFNSWKEFYFDLMSLCFKNFDSKYDGIGWHDKKIFKDLCRYKPKYIVFDDDKRIVFVDEKPDDVIMRLTGSSYCKVPSFELSE